MLGLVQNQIITADVVSWRGIDDRERPTALHAQEVPGLTARGYGWEARRGCGQNARLIATVSEALNRSAQRERNLLPHLESGLSGLSCVLKALCSKPSR